MNKLVKTGAAGLFLCVAAVFSGCSGSTESVETTVDSTVAPVTTVVVEEFPVTVGDLTLAAQPTRIVSLSPTHTEVLYAIGAGSQVVAVDEYSNYPAAAVELGTKLSGYAPNVEAIAGFDPDLVVIAYDPGGLVDQLTGLGVPVYIGQGATNFADVYQQIDDLGQLTGNLHEAHQLVDQMKTEIEDVVGQVGTIVDPISYYYELDNTYYSVTSQTFIGQIFALFGLTNIADSSANGNNYPQLSSEVIVASNPTMIFLADTKCCAQSAQTVAAREGWQLLDAVTKNNIVQLDDDIASRSGPRIVELVKIIGQAVTLVQANK